MPEQTDVIVIGCGVAGAAAALAASRAGARVTVVRAAPGATALTAGGWVTAPPSPIADALAAAGLPLTDCSGGLPHPDGTLVSCATAPTSHARAGVTNGAERLLVCGIAGLPSFRATALARLWSSGAGLLDGGVEGATLTLDATPAGGWSGVSLARFIEREPQRLGAALAHIARERGAARVIVPAVLGLTHHAGTLQAVEAAAGLHVGEALGTAPSIPGWRLDQALLAMLGSAGVAVVPGRIIARRCDGTRVASVTVQQNDRTTSLAARTFVLATGKFLGGGIAARASYTEDALGCDVAVERFTRTISDAGAALVLTDPARLEPQPLLAIGVQSDERGRPLRASGEVSFSNVFVAGSVRGGIETASSGLGAAAHDGWNAGTAAAALTS